jgi:hypothetical protein
MIGYEIGDDAMNQKIFLILMTLLLIFLNNELGLSLICILLISSMVCYIDESCPLPKMPKPKHWGPTISAQGDEETRPELYISMHCPSCGTEYMVTSPEHRFEAPRLVEYSKCGEIFSIL